MPVVQVIEHDLQLGVYQPGLAGAGPAYLRLSFCWLLF